MTALRRVLLRLVRKTVLFLMNNKGAAGEPANKGGHRLSRKRFVIYAGSGLIVVVVVLLVLFVPSKAAVKPVAPLPSGAASATPEPGAWQAAVDNAVPTTEPDIAPIVTTEPDIAPTLTPKPDPTKTPKPDPTKTPKPDPTKTPKPDPTKTPKPDPTKTPKPDPTKTPKPDPTKTPAPNPTATPAPKTDMDKLVDFFVVENGPYYEEGVYSSNHYDYTAGEFDILAKIIQREAGGESTSGKIAVGNVVINRVLCGRWGKSIDAVKEEFSYKEDIVPKQSVIDAAHAVLDDQIWKVPQNAYFFKASGGSWGSYTLWDKLGNHYFYTANFSGRYNGGSVPAVLYERVFKYAQYGCKKEDRVKRIQLMLKALGYEVNADKVFDKATGEALARFQKDAGLTADGVAGRKTVETLITKYGVDKYLKDFGG
jgi:hypothetical protein